MHSIALNRLGIYGSRIFNSAEPVQKWDCLSTRQGTESTQRVRERRVSKDSKSTLIRGSKVSVSYLLSFVHYIAVEIKLKLLILP